MPLEPKPISDITLDYVGTDQISVISGGASRHTGDCHD